MGTNPTDRGNPGTRRGLLTEDGGPRAAVVAPADDHDSTLIRGVIESVVVGRPAAADEHLCLDKGFDTPDAEAAVRAAEQLDARRCPRSEVVWADSKSHDHALNAWAARQAELRWRLEVVRRPAGSAES